MKKTIIIMFGAPCSGKSVISKEYMKDYYATYISSGDIARDMGEEVVKSLDKGELAPEDAMRNRVYEAIKHSDSDIIILDGFPRFKSQMEWLKEHFNDYNFVNIFVDCDKTILINRNMERGRSDNNAFEDRYKYFMLYTFPILMDVKYKTLYNNGEHTMSEMVDILRRSINEMRGDNNAIYRWNG